MPTSRIVTCKYYHRTMGWCGYHMETATLGQDIVAEWANAWAKDGVMSLQDTQKGCWIAFPAKDVLRYEIYEGYHELTVSI